MDKKQVSQKDTTPFVTFNGPLPSTSTNDTKANTKTTPKRIGF